jgi:hypothetical protein
MPPHQCGYCKPPKDTSWLRGLGADEYPDTATDD